MESVRWHEARRAEGLAAQAEEIELVSVVAA